jgi:hypothetical protein
MKKYSKSLFIKEIQITTTPTFHLIPVSMAIFKKINKLITNASKGKMNHYKLVVGMYISANSMEIIIKFPQKAKNRPTI